MKTTDDFIIWSKASDTETRTYLNSIVDNSTTISIDVTELKNQLRILNKAIEDIGLKSNLSLSIENLDSLESTLQEIGGFAAIQRKLLNKGFQTPANMVDKINDCVPTDPAFKTKRSKAAQQQAPVIKKGPELFKEANELADKLADYKPGTGLLMPKQSSRMIYELDKEVSEAVIDGIKEMPYYYSDETDADGIPTSGPIVPPEVNTDALLERLPPAGARQFTGINDIKKEIMADVIKVIHKKNE